MSSFLSFGTAKGTIHNDKDEDKLHKTLHSFLFLCNWQSKHLTLVQCLIQRFAAFSANQLFLFLQFCLTFPHDIL